MNRPPAPTPLRIPKVEAMERLNRHLAEARARLDLAQAQLKAGVSPGKYVLTIQVNALKKEINSCKAHLARIQKEPRAEVDWSDRLGA